MKRDLSSIESSAPQQIPPRLLHIRLILLKTKARTEDFPSFPQDFRSPRKRDINFCHQHQEGAQLLLLPFHSSGLSLSLLDFFSGIVRSEKGTIFLTCRRPTKSRNSNSSAATTQRQKVSRGEEEREEREREERERGERENQGWDERDSIYIM